MLRFRKDWEIIFPSLDGIATCCLSSNTLGLIAETDVGIIIHSVFFELWLCMNNCRIGT